MKWGLKCRGSNLTTADQNSVDLGPHGKLWWQLFCFPPGQWVAKFFFKLLTCMVLVLLWNMHGCRQTLSAPDLGHLIRSLPSASVNILPLKLRSREKWFGGAELERYLLFVWTHCFVQGEEWLQECRFLDFSNKYPAGTSFAFAYGIMIGVVGLVVCCKYVIYRKMPANSQCSYINLMFVISRNSNCFIGKHFREFSNYIHLSRCVVKIGMCSACEIISLRGSLGIY